MKRQKLLTIQNDEYGKCMITKDKENNTFAIEGVDNDPKNIVSRFFFPITQDMVAEEFEKHGKVWRYT